ncbi:MAG: hypothetical protein BGN88_01935 [Clostridiales bacterium 43-6]|nr:MAG: hypothetical protein BGN88_01935 [Clostridiales bacterium 43-6]
MATLKNRLGSLIAKPKMKLEDKKNAGTNTQQTPPAQKSLPNQTTDFAGGSRQSPILSGAVGSRSTSPSNIAGNSGLASQRASSPANGALGGKQPPIFGAVTGGVGAILPKTDSDDDGSKGQGSGRAKDPYIPISVVTGSRDITTVSPELRAFLLKGSPSATAAMPQEYADLANLLNKAGSTIDFQDWADKTAMQQLSITQKAGLSLKDQQLLLNSSPHYVETIAKVQDIFANRYTFGITVADARNVASELFDIASERDAASKRTGKYANDAVFAPKALRWLDEEEKNILDNLTKNASEQVKPKWYNGEDSESEEFKETAADLHRRAQYADIDSAEASKLIETQIMRNMEEAKKRANLNYVYGNAPGAYTTQAKWFLNNVDANKPMDYKNPAVWYKTFPNLPYPKEDQVYDVFGYKVSSSDLGNLNYALVGKTLGIPEWLLLQQAGAAQLKKDEEYETIEAQIKSIQLSHEGYGDQLDDQKMIKNGFSIYNILE